MSLLKALRPALAGVLVTLYAGAAEPPEFAIECLRPGERREEIKVASQDDAVVFEIRDARGIGGARITPKNGDWPKVVILRLHLGGLEQLQISGAKISLFASVLSHSGHRRLLEIEEAGKKRRSAGNDDPLWMTIKIKDALGAEINALPDRAKGGYFEVVVPPALLAGESAALTLHWIDFFR